MAFFRRRSPVKKQWGVIVVGDHDKAAGLDLRQTHGAKVEDLVVWGMRQPGERASKRATRLLICLFSDVKACFVRPRSATPVAITPPPELGIN